jgi:hypothetical protein
MMSDYGVLANSPEEEQQLLRADYQKCHNQLCKFYFSPEVTYSAYQSGQDQISCPHCGFAQHLLQPLGNAQSAEGFQPGGRTISGLSLAEQAQIAEDLVEQMGQLPGYGAITWWHQGGATAKSPLDGATADWGIEVKAVNRDAKNLRFIPGRSNEKAAKNAQAAEMGLKGILGVLVLLDYNRSVADIYVKEMPIDTWNPSQRADGRGGWGTQGVFAYRHHTGNHLVAEIPFKNPLLDYTNSAPRVQSTTPNITDEVPF